ncbi:unnamed protein product, partial [Polarella glacialis]
MLAGLKIGKKGQKEEEEKEEKKNSKKDKKKERRKEQKKKKKDGKKDKKNKKEAADGKASGDSSEESEASSQKPAKAVASVATKPAKDRSLSPIADPSRKAEAEASPPPEQEERRAEVDFFSSLGTERKLGHNLKPDPGIGAIVSEREYNPFLRGEQSNLPAPEDSGAIPKNLCVGDGGNGWRRRAQKRAGEVGAESMMPKPSEGRGRDDRRRSPPRESAPGAPGGRGGPSGGGWRAAKAASG